MQSLKINLGSGADPLPGFVNVDMLDRPDVDVIHNLMEFPYPFDDEAATEIRAIDVVEHLDNYTADQRPSVIAFVEEAYRILKPGGELYIQTPGYRAEFAWQDPTHVRPFHPRTFDLWDEDTDYGRTNGYYSKAKFKVKSEELPNGNLRVWMIKR
jgi:SAM-dependent methyltransferase